MSEETKPVAWMRLWAFNGERAMKELIDGRRKWPQKFKLREVTVTKCLNDDVALYAAPPSAAAIRAMALQECAEMVERWELAHDGADGDLSLLADDMRALSPAPQVTEEWVFARLNEAYEARYKGSVADQAVRATLAALGIEVRK